MITGLTAPVGFIFMTNFVFYLFTVTDLNHFGFPNSDKYIFESLLVITSDATSISNRLTQKCIYPFFYPFFSLFYYLIRYTLTHLFNLYLYED